MACTGCVSNVTTGGFDQHPDITTTVSIVSDVDGSCSCDSSNCIGNTECSSVTMGVFHFSGNSTGEFLVCNRSTDKYDYIIPSGNTTSTTIQRIAVGSSTDCSYNFSIQNYEVHLSDNPGFYLTGDPCAVGLTVVAGFIVTAECTQCGGTCGPD